MTTIKMKLFVYFTLTVTFIIIFIINYYNGHLFQEINSETPELSIVQDAAYYEDIINIHVTRPQIRDEISSVVPEEFLSRNRIAPLENGLKLVEFQDDSLLARYGFRRGDLIKEIDGKKVNTADGIIKICESLENELLKTWKAREISVVLNRDGKDIKINFIIPEFRPEKICYSLHLEKKGKR